MSNNIKEKQIDDEMKLMYNADKNTTAGKWYFDPNKYTESIILCSGMTSSINEQISIAQTERGKVLREDEKSRGQRYGKYDTRIL